VHRDLPAGTVTFLFTDVEGSTRLLEDLGPEPYAEALAEHRRILREAFSSEGGVEVDTQGDAFFVAFPTAPRALRAADKAVVRLAAGPIRVRMGIHTGTPHLTDEGYVGADVHRAARIAAAGHGGQVLVSAATAALVDPERLRDLGEHRLKDLSAPERIYQLGPGDFPSLRSLYRTNLPVPSTPFVGRELELEQVLTSFARPDVRLLTLTGPGGTGKTRLGLQAAAELAGQYPHGVWWVPLAPLRDPRLVLETAAQTLRAEDGLAAHIADRSLLLLFDNFEHLVAAAPEVADLLAACPALDVLVTSREPLHLTGEHEYPVPPLARGEAVDLFVARATAVEPGFEPDAAVSEICRRLDDLPLALELAAARVKALSPPQILDRLQRRLPFLTGGPRDQPQRQQTLRATIEWSHELLRPPEQRLFARLAVFRGGCTLESAEEVASADPDTLGSLVDKSLLRRTEDRFWMLETIREYAVERLDESDESDELRRRHADHFLALAEHAERYVTAGERTWFDRIQRERDNLRAAFETFRVDGDLERVAQLAYLVGADEPTASEQARWFDAVLPHTGALPAPLRAGVLRRAGTVFFVAGELQRSARLFEESLGAYEEVGDRVWAARVRLRLAATVGSMGDPERARRLLEKSLEQATAESDARGIYSALHNMGEVELQAGDLESAASLFEQSAALASDAGDQFELQYIRHGQADVALQRGDLREATRLYRETLATCHYRLSIPRSTTFCLAGLAGVAAREGDCERAGRLWGAAEVLEGETGWRMLRMDRAKYEERVALCAERSPLAFEAAVARGRALTLGGAVEYALGGHQAAASLGDRDA
jgi:predicted ATPase/class 3 adenylate cyclase